MAVSREEEKKWQFGIDLAKATDDEVNEYTRVKTLLYDQDDFTDFDLWELFKDDFKDFDESQFQRVTMKLRSILRKTLRRRGVWVAKNSRSANNSAVLALTVQEDEKHKWTPAEINDLISEEGTLESPQLLARQRNMKAATTATTLGQEPLVSAPLPLTSFSAPTLTQQPGPPQQRGHGREIAEIAKIYTDEQKYGGVGDNFDHKLTIFYDICNRVDLPQELWTKAFPTMLKGLAQDHFYNNLLSQRPFVDICTNIRNFFEGPAYQRNNLDKWNSISLSSIMSTNPEKSTTECLQILINELRQLQYGLTPDLRTTAFIHNKLVTACQGIPACRYATADPPADFGQLINKIQSSIMNFEKEEGSKATQGAYFTDRKFFRNNNGGRHQSRGGGRLQGTGYGQNGSSYNRPPRSSRCFVCNKEECRSWKHTPEEQEQAKSKFKARQFGNKRFDNNYFEKRFQQYVSEYEGDNDSDEEVDLDEVFEALTLDVNAKEDDYSDETKGTSQCFTSLGSMSEVNAIATITELANRSVSHQISPSPTQQADATTTDSDTFKSSSEGRYSSSCFRGVMIDTGASRRSTAGHGQFASLQQIDPKLSIDHSTKGLVTIQFGIGSTSSIGSAFVMTPVGQVEFHIVEADTPFLLSLADMDRLKIYLNNLSNVLVTPSGDVPVVRQFGHPFLLWDTPLQVHLAESFDCNPCYLTTVELQRLHRRFGHPSVRRLQQVLERSGQTIDKSALDHLTRYCSHCQKHGKSPGRFKFTLRDDVEFNHTVIVDIMYINGSPILHIVDEQTRFQTGKWLENISAKHTWDVLRMCWIDTYLGPPDLIVHDAGKNFVSKEFNQLAHTMGITTKAMPVEAHNSIGMVERYHGPLRRAFQIISDEVKDIGKGMALQMAFKALNDTAGPNGLVPTLLVFGAYPRMSEFDSPSATTVQRATAMKKAMAEIKKLRASRQVADALNMRNGPSTTAIHDLPLNSQVLVWREGNAGQTGKWSGPYTLIAIQGETCVVDLPHGQTSFRTTVVKPYLTDDAVNDPEPGEVDSEIPQQAEESPLPQVETQPQKRGRGRPRKHPIQSNQADLTAFLQDDNDTDTRGNFVNSRHAEVMGLIEKGVFEEVDPGEIPEGTRIFNSRFVDEVKHSGTPKAFEKSRLVVQAYNDREKDLVLTQSPTIQRVSQRIILCVAALNLGQNTKLYLRDISQAYVQSVTRLNRNFFIKPPVELTTQLGIGKDSILRVAKPLYGVPEAGNHWFTTYHSHHIKDLHMDQSTYDPCLLYCTKPFGLVGLQTDDTLFLGDNDFATLEQAKLEKAQFLAKQREQLTVETPLKFNGGLIQLLMSNQITLTQERQTTSLALINERSSSTTSSRGIQRHNLTPKDQYVAQRARGAYIASVCQPEAAFDLSFAAQAIQPDDDDIKRLNKRLQWQIENPTRGLTFVKLDVNTLRLLVFTDAAFANNKDLSSQIGYVIVLADASNQANTLHWSSIKCKRVTRSVLASELYGMAHGFDMGASIKATMDKILNTNIPLIVCTDSKSLYDCLVKLGTTQEKRLMIDVMCLRQSYERREIAEVKWIKGSTNPADSMTKCNSTSTLRQLIETNTVKIDTVEWVERKE